MPDYDANLDQYERRTRPVCSPYHLFLLPHHHHHFSRFAALLCQGGAGVRARGHLPAGPTDEGRGQRTGYFLHHPLHRHLLQGGSSNCLLRCTPTRGVLLSFSL
ncbi:hypothetical protein CEXT_809981 [Caerostris extrusa]|uniref:Uncharacterized protein n=1 Tax=Caerostris extrusa TaxID=172846 RepID=A0AAV4UDH5_CAEEX|nr:hypothetical protein CEXT_809981 [Caerostris extrusa]